MRSHHELSGWSFRSPERTGVAACILLALLSTCRESGSLTSNLSAGDVDNPFAQAVPYAPEVTPSELGLAGYAKVLCSAVFVSGRGVEEARAHSGYFLMPERDRKSLSRIHVDRDDGLVTMELANGMSRTAKYYGDQGCIIHRSETETIFFEPKPVETSLPEASDSDWPMGDRTPQSVPAGVEPTKIGEALDIAFENPDSLTAAMLVLYKGAIVGERYGQGADADMQLESWSMGKSLTATLVGLLIQRGHFALTDPAPVPAWQEADDPRSAITIADLLRMSSGLHFIAPRDPDYSVDKGYPDHMYIYTGAVDAFQHSYTKPLQFPPNTEGRYRNSDPLTLGYIIKRTVTDAGGDYLSFPQTALFDKIGIRKQILETDPYGNFLLTGYDYGTARNWARLGLLYLRGGIWQGEQMLPEGFVDFVRSPAPAWAEPVYGGLFWVNGTGEYSLPLDAYFMAGAGGQRTFIVPSHDLVIVRMGHFRGDGPQMREELNRALALIIDAVTPV